MKKKKKIRDKKEEEERKPQRGRNPARLGELNERHHSIRLGSKRNKLPNMI